MSIRSSGGGSSTEVSLLGALLTFADLVFPVLLYFVSVGVFISLVLNM